MQGQSAVVGVTINATLSPPKPADSVTVVVDDPVDPLSYHDPECLETTMGMTELSKAEAEARGAVACSHCFDFQDSVQYPFDYTDGGSL